MKTPAQIINDRDYLVNAIERAKELADKTKDPIDIGIVIGLKNAYMLIYDEVYSING
jgi:hypothetical protein